jgi:ankyrin repeat protein
MELKMKKLVFIFLMLLLAVFSYAQSVDFFDLVKVGSPGNIQLAIYMGQNVNVRDKIGATPLMWAAIYNQDPNVIDVLVEAGAGVESRDSLGHTPLMYAAKRNKNPNIIPVLLQGGADVKMKSNEGKTAYDYALGNPKLKDSPILQWLKVE